MSSPGGIGVSFLRFLERFHRPISLGIRTAFLATASAAALGRPLRLEKLLLLLVVVEVLLVDFEAHFAGRCRSSSPATRFACRLAQRRG